MLKILKILAFSCLCTILCSGCSDTLTLSLEEKVGQLLMVQFHGEVANEDARTLILDTKVGGFIYYEWANGLNSPQEVRTLSASLQELTRSNPTPIPLLIAVDQEGGIVARLNKGFTKFPGNKALGETGEPQLARSVAFAIGQELQSVGINMNLAPVVDVNINPRNPVIGVRSFGENPEIVIAFGQNALNGYREAGIITTLKHFPGHGDVAVDSHEGLPVVNKTIQELQQIELLPFARLAASADAIMTAHILVPALDSENCSTLSKKTLAYLRDTIGFQGVIVADSLVMEGATKKCHTVDEAAIQALEAGCDILLLGGKLLSGEKAGFELSVSDVQHIHGAIVNAVKSGRIPEARLNQAVERILSLKKRYSVSNSDDIPHAEVVSTAAHQAIAKEVACRALKTTKKEGSSILSINEKKIVVFAPNLLKSNIDETSLLRIVRSTNSCFFNLNPSSVEIDTAKQCAENADVLFVCSYNAWKNPSQRTLIQSLIDTKKPVVLIVTRDPLDASLFPEAYFVFRTFSPTPPSIQAVCNKLNDPLFLEKVFSLSISAQDADKIGERIWKNECAGTIEGLTNWKKGENFASLGIGHFIWYPIARKEQFQETFPLLLEFLQKQGATMPDWLKVTSECPWNSREEFYKDIHSAKMKSLRQFLFDTRGLQVVFITNRLEEALPLMVNNCSSQAEKDKITALFSRLAKEENGLYALLDYLNFKGSGTCSKESYKGQGWGLLQVLQRIPISSKQLIADFVKAAKSVLKQRVQNSPPQRQEEQWLKGWYNRLDTYI